MSNPTRTLATTLVRTQSRNATCSAAVLTKKRNFSTAAPRITAADIPSNVINSEYAVRGEVPTVAEQIKAEMDAGSTAYPFSKLVFCNIGNPQACGLKPVTFHRQMLSVVTNPAALEHGLNLPADVLKRGREMNLSLGAYSHSAGHAHFRTMVADYIDRRDGLKETNINDLFLTNGASDAVSQVLELLVSNENDVMLIPIPQYPLYSASATRLGGTWWGYEMGEDYGSSNPGWKCDVSKIQAGIDRAKKENKRIKALCVINPGNPTGNVMDRAEIEAVLKLASEHGIPVFADEVYQDNVYADGKKFWSFRQVRLEMGLEDVQLFSFHSISKGYYGECGIRGGYVHCEGVDESVKEQLLKLMSMKLCSNTLGQAMTASILNPPVEGEESFALFDKERSEILSDMKEKAALVTKRLNEIKGFQCMPIEGAMYAFPQVDLPPKFIQRAKDMGRTPDSLYCLEVLKGVGVVSVPGSGFGQREGTYHLRLTILPQKADLVKMLDDLEAFQERLYAEN